MPCRALEAFGRCGSVPISSGWAVGLSAWPSTARLRQRRGAKAPLSALAARVSEGLPKGEGASSALRNLSQAVYGLAHRAPTILGHPDVVGPENGRCLIEIRS